MEAKDVTDISDALFTTIRYGKTTFDQLGPAMGRISSIAYSAGVSLEEVAAAMATLTRSGVTTDEAVTGLKGLLIAYLKSSGALEAHTLANKGLIGALKELRGLSAEQMATTIIEQKAMIAATVLVDNMTGLQRDYTAALNDTGAASEAFKIATDNAQNSVDIFQESLNVLSITAGDLFLPAITGATDGLSDFIDTILNNKETLQFALRASLMSFGGPTNATRVTELLGQTTAGTALKETARGFGDLSGWNALFPGLAFLGGQSYNKPGADATAHIDAYRNQPVPTVDAGVSAEALAKAAAAAAKAKKEADALAKATERATKTINAQIDALELQVATFGMSTEEATLYKMALDGATDEQLALAEAALDSIIALETVERQQRQTTEAMEDAAESSFGHAMAEAVSGWASGFSATLNDMVWDADAAFTDIAESFAKMLTQMVIQRQVVEPALGGMTSWMDSWGAPDWQKPGFIGPPSPFTAGTPHAGGVIGMGGIPSRTVSPGLFAGAPRLHSGLFANEFPAILEKGETVIPKGGGASGGCNVKVIVNNMGEEKTAQQQDAPRWNGQEWVVTVWMDAYNRNVGGLRRAFGR